MMNALRGPDFLVSGLVYKVQTGSVEIVVPDTPLRVE